MTVPLPPSPPFPRPPGFSPCFSSGPCRKPPTWDWDKLQQRACLGRSHRNKQGKQQLGEVIAASRELLGIPADYKLAIVPGSDTGAMEIALWNLLGTRGVDMLAWESFGNDWLYDATAVLPLDDVQAHTAPYGRLPDLSAVDPRRDTVFTWNGTTSGTCVPSGGWLGTRDATDGLVICDATSAVFAVDLPWHQLDVVTWSWQKVMGGEAAHGMLALSPKAIARLEQRQPPWPIPKLFRLHAKGAVDASLFEGSTRNTPSMLCVADALVCLDWIRDIGGLPAMLERTQRNFQIVARWVHQTDWVDFLAADPATRSTTSICLTVSLPSAALKRLLIWLEDQAIGYDMGAYRSAPPGLRIWGGGAVEADDIRYLLDSIDHWYGSA